MKTVIFASAVLILCIAAVVVNCVYISAMTDSMLDILDGDGRSYDKVLEDFGEMWEENRFIISLSVNGMDIDEVNKTLARARGYAENSDGEAAEVAIGELNELIRAVADDERFTAEGIL